MSCVNEATAWRLNQLVDRYCLANHLPLFGHDPMHRCKTGCVMLGTFPGPFICAASRQIHLCGRQCSAAVDTGEGVVCTLTGYQVGETACAAPMIVRDSAGRSTRHWGNVSARKGSPIENKATVVAAINKALRLFLCSDARRKITQAEEERYANAATKLCRKLLLGERTRRLYAAAVVEIRQLAEKHEPCCRPAASPEAAWIDVLAPELYRYFTDVGTVVGKKTAVTLAAVGISLLAAPNGYKAEGVTYVEHSPTVAACAFVDVMYGRFPGITCRRMSILQREMISLLQTSGGQQRIIEPLRLVVGR